MRLILAIGVFFSGAAAYADQVFIEGFPDVPLLEGMTEQTAERLVFDAPSGTVAETAIRAEKPGIAIIADYAKELPSFGWRCERIPSNLRCTREKNVLVFSNKTPAEESGLIILRLEPAG